MATPCRYCNDGLCLGDGEGYILDVGEEFALCVAVIVEPDSVEQLAFVRIRISIPIELRSRHTAKTGHSRTLVAAKGFERPVRDDASSSYTLCVSPVPLPPFADHLDDFGTGHAELNALDVQWRGTR